MKMGAVEETPIRPAAYDKTSPERITLAGTSPRGSWRGAAIHCVFFAALMYCAHFWYSGSYGIYEDDFVAIPKSATYSWSQTLGWIKEGWTHIVFGRPICQTLQMLVPWIGLRFGNLHALYAFSSLFVAANAVLFYLLLRRAFTPTLAVLGTSAYCLFPAETSRQLLIHSTIIQPSMMFALIAAHCYLSRRYVLTYVLLAATLMTYESPLLPMLFLPLLRRGPWDRRTLRALIIHGSICGALAGLDIGVRLALGERRLTVVSSNIDSVPWRVLTSLYLGPFTSLIQFYRRSAFALAEAKAFGTAPAILAGALAFAALLLGSVVRWRRDAAPAMAPAPAPGRELAALSRPLLTGLLMLIVSYALAFTPDHYPPTVTAGRMTSVHLGATVGGSILVGCLCELLLILFGAARLRPLGAAALAAYFGTLIGFTFIVQKSFVIGRDDQRTFWTRVIELCPDLQEHTTILVEGAVPVHNGFAPNSSWSDPLVLPQLFRYPASFEFYPILAVVPPGEWTNLLSWQGEMLAWKQPFPPFTCRPAGVTVGENDLILLRQIEFGTKLERVEGEVKVDGKPFKLKGPVRGASALPYPPGVLYPLLIDESRLPLPMRHGEPPIGPLLKWTGPGEAPRVGPQTPPSYVRSGAGHY